ncbi:MAG: hypothetical protein Q8S03_16875 [Brevundimonas sp.]|uniref:hypothetical protein n=1 Tax=Brevundimonas sp. TaxID=1871086 RepID=UPI0027375872|nr:hypothetical protein [Brevundimonas sp.]MDP3406366.1 hypothetical protein [Brevundimonas sp.]
MSVIIRKVQTALHRQYQKAGGIPVGEAIEQAEGNLVGLTEECLARIDESIELIARMTVDPHRKPSTKDLRRAHALINDMLALCAVIDMPALVDALYAAARLVASLIETDYWLDGALTPAVNLLRLTRRGVVSPEDLEQLILGIDQCGERISRHARVGQAG